MASRATKKYNSVSILGSCFGADLAYFAALQLPGAIDKLVLHAPWAPFEKKALKRYLPKAWVIQHPIYSRIASLIRNSKDIALSQATGIAWIDRVHRHTIFDQDNLREYLSYRPIEPVFPHPIEIVGCIGDSIVPHEHTEEIYNILKKRHPYVFYHEIEADHYVFRKEPALMADIFVQDRKRPHIFAND